jgi:hypothetical protein
VPFDHLTELIAQATAGAEGSPNDERFVSWRQRCLVAIRTVVGPEHDLMREFESIQFALPPGWLGRSREEAASIAGGRVVMESQHFFRERVYDAREVLIATRLHLRND